MSISSVPAAADPWPLKLAQKQNLRLCRGEVVAIDNALYAIVGFDGRHESYTCWLSSDQGVSFDTSRFVTVSRLTAHNAARDLNARNQVPPLPPLDHLGRVALPPVAEEGGLDGRAASTFARRPSSTSSGQTSPMPPFAPSFLAEASQASGSTKASTPTGTKASTPEAMAHLTDQEVDTCGSPEVEDFSCKSSDMLTPASPTSRAIVPYSWEGCDLARCSQSRRCNQVCGILRVVAITVSCCLQHLGQRLMAGFHAPRREALCDRPPASRDASSPERGSETQATSDAIRDLQITIPIVRPPCWEQVQALIDQCAIGFDERGLKENMTIKPERWNAFVDRQRAKLEKEIRDMHKGKDLFGGKVKRTPSDAEREGHANPEHFDLAEGDSEDIGELLHMIAGMEDWKDLRGYSGRSISMSSTQQGNEMKIHVMAFAERDDGKGIDFMRLSYKKWLEVKEAALPSHAPVTATRVAPGLLALLPLISKPVEKGDAREQWTQLLQRPDVAKFTIALAFQNAMAKDGVRLSFCDSQGEAAPF